MRRQRHRHAKPTVATHFPSLSRGPDLNLNAHMFTQDVPLAVMPIGGRTDKHKNFNVALDGENDACERAQHLIEGIARYDRHGLVGIVCDAVEEIARHLAWEGCAVYEVIHDGSDSLHIHGFTSRRLIRLPGGFLQIVPPGDWELWKKKWNFIPASKVWYFEMPSSLGGRKGYRTVLKKLRQFERLGPPFWRQDIERGKQSKSFDFQLYVRSTDIYLGRVTKEWGWNRRDWSQERSTEFFNFYKMVSFRLAQAVLREHIVDELNRLFARLRIACQLRISGLPTADDILTTKRELLGGKISFALAAERTSL